MNLAKIPGENIQWFYGTSTHTVHLKVRVYIKIYYAWLSISACPSATVVTVDELALSILPPLVYPPITMIALSLIIATATKDRANVIVPTFSMIVQNIHTC